MHQLTRLRRARLLPAATLLLLGLLISPLTTRSVHAGLGTCASCPGFGPIITLSDGTKINTAVSVQDTLRDIQTIAYTVHVPIGLAVTSISYQGSTQVSQSASVIADEALPNSYDVDTFVSTGAAVIAVYPSTQVRSRSRPRAARSRARPSAWPMRMCCSISMDRAVNAERF